MYDIELDIFDKDCPENQQDCEDHEDREEETTFDDN